MYCTFGLLSVFFPEQPKVLVKVMVTIMQHFIISFTTNGKEYFLKPNDQLMCVLFGTWVNYSHVVVVWRVKGRRVIHHFSLCIPKVHESIVFSHILLCPALSYPVISQTLGKGPANDTLLNHSGWSQSLTKETCQAPPNSPCSLYKKENQIHKRICMEGPEVDR